MNLMNELDRKRFLATMRHDEEFRAAVRRELLTEELLNLPQTVATLVDVVADQRKDLTALATEVRNYMQHAINAITEGFTVVRGEISELRTDMEAGFTDLRTDMEAGFTAVDAKFDLVNAELRVMKDQLAS